MPPMKNTTSKPQLELGFDQGFFEKSSWSIQKSVRIGSNSKFDLKKCSNSKQLNIILFLNKLNQNSEISAEEFVVLVKIDREN